MSNRVQRIYDAAVALRTSVSAITTTTSDTGISFPVRNMEDYKASISYSGVVGTGTYTFAIQVSNLVAGTYTTIASVTINPAVSSGRLDIPLNGKIAEQLDDDSAFIRVTATLGGTSPSVVYNCFLSKE